MLFEIVSESSQKVLFGQYFHKYFFCVHVLYCMNFYIVQGVLKNLKSHQQVFQGIHNDRSVDGVPVSPDQLQDMAERYFRQDI